jgi:hypothetical protein
MVCGVYSARSLRATGTTITGWECEMSELKTLGSRVMVMANPLATGFAFGVGFWLAGALIGAACLWIYYLLNTPEIAPPSVWPPAK